MFDFCLAVGLAKGAAGCEVLRFPLAGLAGGALGVGGADGPDVNVQSEPGVLQMCQQASP